MMSITKKLLVIFFLIIAISGFSQTDECFIKAEVTEFQYYIDSCINELVFDVRPVEMFQNNIISNAIQIPTLDELQIIMDTLDRDIPILVYCTIGVRSEKVCKILCEKNFNLVVNLNGGIDNWKKNNFKTVKSKKD